ncbi:GNAT family N-acetyltransferase [candidate division WOR-3 bacterium]|nr:GNAT family N-acetyltransferase [candidate division WOR-3 bacterium]
MDDIVIEPYKDELKEKWDNFVEKANNGTVFHRIQFLNYHPPRRFKFHHLVFQKESNPIALLPGMLNKGVYKSPAGASFGGIVMDDMSFRKTDIIVNKFLEYCKKTKIKEVYLTLPPVVYSKEMNKNLEYVLLYNGFSYSNNMYTSVINLSQLEKDPIKNFHQNARNAINKGEKSELKVKLSEDYETFYPILLKNKEKFKVSVTHSLDELKKLNSLLPDTLKLFLVYRKGVLLGGSLIFVCNERALLAFYIALDYYYQQYRPINYLLYEIIKWGQKNKFKYLDLGVNQEESKSNPMEVNRGLISFKSSMGAQCFFRNQLYKKI